MDWKSMTVPASLPITTDFFPDHRSLQNDYSIGEYTLLAEMIAFESESRSLSRKSLSTSEVFKEMIGQRLAKGFQLVIFQKKVSVSDMTSLSSSPYATNSLVRGRKKQQMQMQYQEEHILSIGRIFHTLSLKGNTITVTRYWPRHPYPQKSIHYTYRFQVPDSDSYDVSWTNFSNEKLENYNWNKHDNFICSHGEDNNFSLMESLNHWRARFMLLPVNIPATKKIIEGSSERCDIYEYVNQNSKENCQQLISGFLRFLEIMNNIRRSAQNRKTKILPRRASLTQTLGHLAEKDKSSESSKKHLKRSDTTADTPVSSPYSSSFLPPVDPKKSQSSAEMGSGTVLKDAASATAIDISAPEQLTSASSMVAVIDAMIDSGDGLVCIPPQPGLAELPKNTFIAAEAATWVMNHLLDVTCIQDAVEYLQTMIEEEYICHASGNKKHKFIYGFYLYYISVDRDKARDSTAKRLPSDYYNKSFSFQNEWCEVACHDTSDFIQDPSSLFHPILPKHLLHSASEFLAPELSSRSGAGFMKPEIPQPGSSTGSRFDSTDLTLDLTRFTPKRRASPFYKLVNADSDPNQKSERPEWGSVRYHGNYSPDSAFELETQWLVVTGCILGDLMNTWSRKAGSCGFHLLPVPGDPFALPFNDNSDPLRGPIFIPLNVSCLKDSNQPLFSEFDVDSRDERLLLLQDSILKRFGFMQDKPPNINYPEDMQAQYVHCSGGMFVLIPDNKTTSPRNLDGTHRKPVVGSYKHYIAWQRGRSESSVQMNEVNDPFGNQDQRTGFLWAWNFMLNKRFRTNHTGDEHFQDKILADFRAFCLNTDNRLREYWDDLRHKVMQDGIDEEFDEPLTVNF